jgi:hypothetical protein
MVRMLGKVPHKSPIRKYFGQALVREKGLQKEQTKMIETKARTKRIPTLVWIGGIVVVLALLAYFLADMLMGMSAVPSNLDTAATQVSENGLFNVSYTAATGEVPVNQMHQWTVHIENAGGEPVENATITVDGDMPQHGHGLPTKPQVTKYLGNGDYLVEGLKFQMGGWWVMDFNITANGQADAVHFNMMLR